RTGNWSGCTSNGRSHLIFKIQGSARRRRHEDQTSDRCRRHRRLVGVAFATPIVGLISPLLAVGKQSSDIHVRGTALMSNGERFKVELETEGPSTITIQDTAFAAGV